jgi:pimeloyl-ACP methyl ester carboxylesterase
MRITMNDGVELAVEVSGEGPGLLLVHGLGGAKIDWADHVEALAREHTVVTFDHRGHGDSDNPTDPGAYSFERLAHDAIEVADAIGLDRFRLLGHSMGGMVARKIAILHSERVEALVMMDTFAGPIPGFDPELAQLGADVALTQGKQALKDLLDFISFLDTPAHQKLVVERPDYVDIEARRWDGLSEIAWGALVLGVGAQSDDLPALAALPCPVLVLVGEQDESFIGTSRAMADGIPGAQLVVFPDAGHSPQVEVPDAWIDALTGFLAALPAPAH